MEAAQQVGHGYLSEVSHVLCTHPWVFGATLPLTAILSVL